LKRSGYRIEIVYLRLHSTRLAVSRVAARVKQGGHDVPKRDVIRRFSRSWRNFDRIYRLLADSWAVYDNSGDDPRLLDEESMKAKTRAKAERSKSFTAGIRRAVRRAAKDARKTARMYGTPLYVWENGRVVAKRP
jgi:predicted ABC-type ATPase